MIYPVVTDAAVETFDLRVLKSYGSSEDLLSLEMTDLWGERYRKNYGNTSECLSDIEAIDNSFKTGNLLPLSA